MGDLDLYQVLAWGSITSSIENIAKLSAADVSRNVSTIFVKDGNPKIALIDTDLLDLSKR